MNLIYHCSEFRTDVLEPDQYEEKAICLSEKRFVGALGQWLYIFDKDRILKDLPSSVVPSGGMGQSHGFLSRAYERIEINYESIHLGYEYRVKSAIDVNKYAVDVIENMNVLKGEVAEIIDGEIRSKKWVNLTRRQR